MFASHQASPAKNLPLPQLNGNAEQIMEESPESIDNLLSKELLQLSLRDRNAIDEEIHGVTKLAVRESPELLKTSLEELSEELRKIPDTMPWKAAFMESQIFPETYVNTPDFRLRFLRCELFDAPKAAVRLVKFLDLAQDLFGPQVLQRPMQVNDFDKDEAKLLNTGNVQVLPYRDRTGRPVFAWVGDFGMLQGTAASRLKASLYLHYAVSDDVECQREGITWLVWAASSPVKLAKPDWESIKFSNRLFEGAPVRTGATHFCLPDKPYFHMLRFAVALAQGKNHLSRNRFHVGEDVELMYQVKAYGIPVELIPVTGTGNIKTLYLKQWLKARKYLDELRSSKKEGEKNGGTSSVIICPKSTDVIFKRGRSLLSHPGNSAFQSLIESWIKEHSVASKDHKIAITKTIIMTVRQQGGGTGRFLTWDSRGNWWTVLKDESEIHVKVASFIKECRKKYILQQNTTQTSRSSTTVFQNQDHAKRRKISAHKSVGGSDSEGSSDGECTCLF